MTADYNFSFATSAQPFVCSDPATFIHDIQGNGPASPLDGSVVTVEGVVVGSFQGTNQFGGFHIQEEDAEADADPRRQKVSSSTMAQTHLLSAILSVFKALCMNTMG